MGAPCSVWQSRQWQNLTSNGSVRTSYTTAPQLHLATYRGLKPRSSADAYSGPMLSTCFPDCSRASPCCVSGDRVAGKTDVCGNDSHPGKIRVPALARGASTPLQYRTGACLAGRCHADKIRSGPRTDTGESVGPEGKRVVANGRPADCRLIGVSETHRLACKRAT